MCLHIKNRPIIPSPINEYAIILLSQYNLTERLTMTTIVNIDTILDLNVTPFLLICFLIKLFSESFRYIENQLCEKHHNASNIKGVVGIPGTKIPITPNNTAIAPHTIYIIFFHLTIGYKTNKNK